LSLLLPLSLLAQDDKAKDPIPLDHFYAKPRHGSNIIRRVLHNVHFGLYTGSGATYYNTKLNGWGIYQAPGSAPQLFTNTPSTRYSNWIHNASEDTSAPGNYIVASSGTSGLGFKGKAFNVPIAATVHYEFDRYRFGLGYSYELMNIGSLHSKTLTDKIENMPGIAGTNMRKYWFMAGVSFFRMDNYLLTGDVQVGNYKLKTNFNQGEVKTSLYFNLGITAEKELSEYFKIFIRPAYEFKSYNLTPPSSSQSIHFNTNAMYLQIGFTYSIPELPRCFLRDCAVQINHAHGNKEYRSRRHPFYKKQNPGYGENNPVLIKYKGKNKRKLNPY